METLNIFGMELSLGKLTVIAILLSPAIAVGVSTWMWKYRERLQSKKIIFASLMATRHQGVSLEEVRSLNLIDVVFYNEKKVRDIWHEYFDMLHNTGLNNPVGWERWNDKKLELIQAMAKVVGYGKKITHLDVNRVYRPVGLAPDTGKAIGTEAKPAPKKKKTVKKKTQKKK